MHANERLPRPQPEPKWRERAAFLQALDRADGEAPRIAYVAFLFAASADAEMAMRVFDWMSGSGLPASDTM